MNVMGFDSNLVALNCLIDGLGKSGQIDRAIRLFDSMEVRDSFTYTSLVYNLFKARRYKFASELLLSCVRDGMEIPKSAKRAVLNGLRGLGLIHEAKNLQSKIRMAWILR
ncbi:hypothetical protein TIFTF001_047327 [Ficus carica]|uniref:Pentatricopeptide repeat-containing protein n=1 Tax=Ficus carica TaxID=3494 RepID=A0AA87YSM4_FICCA|nr:hypothetical protein TIFTF001_047327 [Ficus carica]